MSEKCKICGKPSLPSYQLTAGLWLVIMGNAKKENICLACFDHRAREKNIELFWECSAAIYPTDALRQRAEKAETERNEAIDEIITLKLALSETVEAMAEAKANLIANEPGDEDTCYATNEDLNLKLYLAIAKAKEALDEA
jgi:hypothetical protein